MTVFSDYFGNKEDEVVKEKKLVIGKILRLSDEGWGFIISKDIPFEKIFFHWTALEQDTLRFPKLEEGMEVEFFAVEQEENRGYRAIKIRVVKQEEDNNGIK